LLYEALKDYLKDKVWVIRQLAQLAHRLLSLQLVRVKIYLVGNLINCGRGHSHLSRFWFWPRHLAKFWILRGAL